MATLIVGCVGMPSPQPESNAEAPQSPAHSENVPGASGAPWWLTASEPIPASLDGQTANMSSVVLRTRARVSQARQAFPATSQMQVPVRRTPGTPALHHDEDLAAVAHLPTLFEHAVVLPGMDAEGCNYTGSAQFSEQSSAQSSAPHSAQSSAAVFQLHAEDLTALVDLQHAFGRLVRGSTVTAT